MSAPLQAARHRPLVTRADAVAAACALVIAVGLLVGAPALAQAGEEPLGFPLVGSAAWWAVLATLLAQAVALAAARRLPRLAPVAVAALPVLLAVIAPGTAFGTTSVGAIVASYLAGVRLRRPRIILVAGSLFVLTAIATSVNVASSEGVGALSATLAGAAQAAFVIGAPLVLALLVASRRQARAAHERELAAVRREQDARVASAIAAERTAVARDLHDIAAHHMSGIAMMASALERQVDRDPQSAKESARDIRSQSTAVLGDLRRLVGLLRDDDSAPLADRCLDSIPQLVGDRRTAGAAVALMVEPRDADVGAGVGTLAQLVAYRMVQESLANAAVHAPGAPCEVRIDATTPTRVRITVVNGPQARTIDHDERPGGFGLIGMRERAELVGAHLDHGPTRDGGWSVTLDLPREGSILHEGNSAT